MTIVKHEIVIFQIMWYNKVTIVIETAFDDRAQFLPERNCVRFFEVEKLYSFHSVK